MRTSAGLFPYLFPILFLSQFIFTADAFPENSDSWSKISFNSSSVYEDCPQHVQCYSKDSVYILTSNGFFYSHNGGTSFSKAAATGNEMCFDFPEGKTGYIAGLGGILKKTTDGGASWTALPTSVSSGLYGIDFKSKSTGLAVGENGVILKTTNGGDNWRQITSGTAQLLAVVRWITDKVVLAAGYGGVMLRSIDAGETFTAVASPDLYNTLDIEVYNSEHPYTEDDRQMSVTLYDESFILAVGSLGQILRSTDMGITWTSVGPDETNFAYRKTFMDVSIADSKRMFASGLMYYNGSRFLTLYESVNGGKTWAVYSLPDSYLPVKFDFIDHYNLFGATFATGEQYGLKYKYNAEDATLLTPNLENLVFSGRQIIPVTWTANNITNVSLHYSTDGGSSWSIMNDMPAGAGIYNWEIPDKPAANYLVRVQNKLNESVSDENDYPFTVRSEYWQSYSTGIKEPIRAADFPSFSTAYAAGDDGLLIKSADSAKTWQRLASGTSADLFSVSFYDADNGIAAGQDGVIIKTTNGGASWTQLPSLNNLPVKKVLYIDPLKILLLNSNSNRIYISNNGGSSWDYVDAPGIINDITYAGQTGYAAGENGLILKSSGNIFSWQTVASGVTGNMLSVSFYSDNIGYIALSQGTVLATKDGGATWSATSTGETRNNIEVKAVSYQTAFLLASDGYIYSTDNNGISWQEQSFRFHNIVPQYYHALAFSPIRNNFRGLLAIAAGEGGNIIRKSYGIPEHSLAITGPVQSKDYLAGEDTVTVSWRSCGIKYVNISLISIPSNEHIRLISGVKANDEICRVLVTREFPAKFRFEVTSDDDGALRSSCAPAFNLIGYFVKSFKDFCGYDSETDEDPSVQSISLWNQKNGVISTGNVARMLFVTHDAGAWSRTFKSELLVHGGENVAVGLNVYAADSLNMTASGLCSNISSVLLGSTDGGNTWQRRKEVNSMLLMADYQLWLDTQTGFIRSRLGQTIKTTDGGYNWIDVSFPEIGNGYIPNLISWDFYDENSGVARSSSGSIYYTTDRGDSWRRMYTDETAATAAFGMIDRNTLIALTNYNSADSSLHVRRSTNGGADWNTVYKIKSDGYINNLDILSEFAFVNDSVGLLNCNEILHLTEDKGATWRMLDFSREHTFKDISKPRGGKFIAAGSKDGAFILLHNASPGSDPLLPVELTSFSARSEGASVILDWITATEINNYGFEIERAVRNSESGVLSYGKIGFVAGAGNSNGVKEYSFTDSTAKAGKYSYRLKQIDNDGKYKYPGTVEISVSVLPKKYSLSQNYPNPFNPTTTIRYQLPEAAEVDLKVFDMLGREVRTLLKEMQNAGNYDIVFDSAGLASGIYILKLTAGKYTKSIKMSLLK